MPTHWPFPGYFTSSSHREYYTLAAERLIFYHKAWRKSIKVPPQTKEVKEANQPLSGGQTNLLNMAR